MRDTTGWVDRTRCVCSSCTEDAASTEDFYDWLRRDVVGRLAGPLARIHAVTLRKDFQAKDPEDLPDSRAVWTNALLNALADIGRGKGYDVVPNRLYYFRKDGGKDHNSKYDVHRQTNDSDQADPILSPPLFSDEDSAAPSQSNELESLRNDREQPVLRDPGSGSHPPRDSGEFMVDMAWWPPGTLAPWWDQPSSIDLTCELAIESEWGAKEGSDFHSHAGTVANDYLKILSIRAQHRLLLTSCRDADRPRFIQVLKTLRERAGLPAGSVCVWLWRDSDRWAQIYSPVAMTP